MKHRKTSFITNKTVKLFSQITSVPELRKPFSFIASGLHWMGIEEEELALKYSLFIY